MPATYKKSIITCIKCGHKKEEEMPQYASKTAYTCSKCKNTITIKPTNCCVFCSYGNVPCPPTQRRSSIEGNKRSIEVNNSNSLSFSDR